MRTGGHSSESSILQMTLNLNQFSTCASKNIGFKQWLMDPSYNIENPKILRLINEIKDRTSIIGLHPSFDSWNDGSALIKEKERLEKAAKIEVKSSRQHWLRFSWEQKTWECQEKAGLKQRHDSYV